MVSNGCEPELSLRLSSALSCPYAKRREEEKIQQQITVFHGGRICVWNVTDHQAKVIMCMEGSMKEQKQQQFGQKLKELSPCQSLPSSLSTVSQLIDPELSMKRSLKAFLQKRKARIDAASPYSIHRN